MNSPSMDNLPWSKREIIEAAIARYRPHPPLDIDDPTTFVEVQAALIEIFAQLALGRPEGRQPPYIEAQLYGRIGRVWRALDEGRDPNAAYEVPRAHERPLTTDDQLSWEYRQMAELFDREDKRRRESLRRR